MKGAGNNTGERADADAPTNSAGRTSSNQQLLEYGGDDRAAKPWQHWEPKAPGDGMVSPAAPRPR